jgi:hypothetical protein
VPAEHTPASVQDDWLTAVEKVPAAHIAQARFVVDVPAEATYCPGSQVVHAVHVAAFEPALNVPLGHPVHVRSPSAVPAELTC